VWQVEALPILTGRGALGGTGFNISKKNLVFNYFFLVRVEINGQRKSIAK
jgi:hypothetical protein